LICIVVCEPRTARAGGVMEMIFQMRVYIFITSKFKFDSLGRLWPTRAPRPPERHAPGARGSNPPAVHRPEPGTEPGIEVLAPAASCISCMANNSRAVVLHHLMHRRHLS
jgi:hypothetical protein